MCDASLGRWRRRRRRAGRSGPSAGSPARTSPRVLRRSVGPRLPLPPLPPRASHRFSPSPAPADATGLDWSAAAHFVRRRHAKLHLTPFSYVIITSCRIHVADGSCCLMRNSCRSMTCSRCSSHSGYWLSDLFVDFVSSLCLFTSLHHRFSFFCPCSRLCCMAWPPDVPWSDVGIVGCRVCMQDTFTCLCITVLLSISNIRTELFAGRVACWPLVSHVEYAPMGQTDGRTNARPLHYAFGQMWAS